MTRIAFIGTGVMGAPIANHLKQQGHQVKVYNRTFKRAEKAAETYGYEASQSLKDAVIDAEVVFTMLGYPQDVQEVYEDETNGIFAHAAKQALLVDLTTSTPELAKSLALKGESLGFDVLDAPVSGGDQGALRGQLVIMAGGSPQAFQRAEAFLSCFGKPTHLGPAGAGQHAKAANQIVVAGNTAAYTEAIAYLRAVDLDPKKVFEVIQNGAAGSWQLQNMAPRALKGDFPPGFYIKHFIKDMTIALGEAEKQNLSLPVLKTVLELYQAMAEHGNENLGTQALIKEYEEEA